jgi:hypothetical protein
MKVPFIKRRGKKKQRFTIGNVVWSGKIIRGREKKHQMIENNQSRDLTPPPPPPFKNVPFAGDDRHYIVYCMKHSGGSQAVCIVQDRYHTSRTHLATGRGDQLPCKNTMNSCQSCQV